jgi:cytochrome c oxidase subunit IV
MAAALPDQVNEPPAATYVVVWFALVVLATITLFASRASIGEWKIAVSLAIAAIKALLVLAYFMHLAYGRALPRIVFGIAVTFVVLIILGVLADVATRSIASSYVEGS